MTLIVAGSSQISMKGKCIAGNIFEGEMLIITLPTTFFQLFCEIILNSEVIIKSIIDPGNTNFFQSFCEIILNSEVIVKSIIDPVNNFEIIRIYGSSENLRIQKWILIYSQTIGIRYVDWNMSDISPSKSFCITKIGPKRF